MLLKGLKYSLLVASVVLALSGCDGDEGNKNAAAPAAKQTVKSTAVSDNAVKDGEKKDVKETAEVKDFGSLEKNASYALGTMLGSDLKANFVDANKKLEIVVDPDLIKEGFVDAIEGKSKLTREQAIEKLEKFQEMFEKKAKEQAAKKSSENLQKGKDFLAQNAKKENVKVTSSGLQYIVNVEGTGEKVKAPTDIVKVVYTGKLIDGTVFDSNAGEGKQPIEFPLANVIPGWTEGLQLMSVGSEYTFFIPSELAYGSHDTGMIPANSVLIFDVKLLDVKHKEVKSETKPTVKEEVKDAAKEVKEAVKEEVKEVKSTIKETAKETVQEVNKKVEPVVIDEVDIKAELAKEPLDNKEDAVKQ